MQLELLAILLRTSKRIAHATREKFDTIRVGADSATIALANETVRKIDALAAKEIQRVRAAGRVESACVPPAASNLIEIEMPNSLAGRPDCCGGSGAI